MKTHGLSHSKIWNVWRGMMKRCYDGKHKAYGRYGGRGIDVIEAWHTFENFYADMGFPPDGMTLDRINNDGPYSKENCRWATWTEQQNNRRNNIRLQWNGKTLSITEWAVEVNLPSLTIRDRIRNGWNIERVLTEPRHIEKIRQM